MVAGLSMFPLTALEGAIYAAPVLIAEVASALLQVDTLNLTSLISTSWLVVIIAVVATLSSMSQLGFVISLVRNFFVFLIFAALAKAALAAKK